MRTVIFLLEITCALAACLIAANIVGVVELPQSFGPWDWLLVALFVLLAGLLQWALLSVSSYDGSDTEVPEL